MNSKRPVFYTILGLFFCCFLVGMTEIANAALEDFCAGYQSCNQATIEWNNITTPAGLDIYNSWSGSWGGWGSDADNISHTVHDYSESTSGSDGIVDTYASAFPGSPTIKVWASTNEIDIASKAGASADSGPAYAYSGAMRSIMYYAPDAGTMTFTVPYSFSQSIENSQDDLYGYVRAWAWIQFYNTAAEEWQRVVEVIREHELTSGDYEEGPENMNLSVDVYAGQYFKFELGTDAVASAAPVPVPSAVLLLGSGMVGMLIIGRRRR